MARKPTGKPNGRPPKEIDEKTFKNLCGIQCTKEELAGVFECDPTTLDAWCKRTFGETFPTVYKRYSQNGKVSLRRTQFRLAEKSASMAIFLGKQYLGQTDKVEQVINEIEDLTPLAALLRKNNENITDN